MPVKKTTTKKTATKKPTVAKKTVAKKTTTKKTVAKKSTAPKTVAPQNTSSFDKMLDKCVAKMQKKCSFISKIMNLDIIKTILGSKIMDDTNKWVKKNIANISQILGRLIVVFGGIAVLMSLSTMGRLFSYFGAGYTILLLLNIAYLLIGMVFGYGLIKMKKRVPFFVTFTVLIDLVYIIIASILWGTWAISSPRSVIFYIIFMLYVLKNKSLFNK